MKKILTVLGARPQFIKAASVSRAFAQLNGLREVLVHTGQHFDANMSEIFFNELELPKPEINLGISSSSHGAMTGDMLKQLERVMQEQQPDMVVVYGDTNSTLAGALAASKLNIPIAHIEAGLRSFNRQMPEEINRVLTDHCSDLLFTPTDSGSANLVNEGITPDKIRQCGDVMFDSAVYYGELANRRGLSPDTFGVKDKGYVLATIHRQENTDHVEKLHNILLALNEVAKELPVVFPIHPRTENAINAANLHHLLKNIITIEPTGFLEMIVLERGAVVVTTDSGGVQKEAFFHSVPCVTIREETEWPELVSAGWNTLAPPESSDAVQRAILSAIGTSGVACSPYGNGAASSTIAEVIKNWLH